MSQSMDQNNTDAQPSRYIVGIDLGTTNCAVTYIDTQGNSDRIEVFSLFQYVSPGVRENRQTLPSFCYAVPSEEKGAFPGLGSRKYIVGTYARDYGLSQPGRQISSAKSWLCHTRVDRTSAFLPWKAPEEVEKISPVDASANYLKFISDAWTKEHPTEPLSQQDLVITLPASFDETARELTIRAAKKAGLHRILLIEEPQAAFYAWIYKQINNGQGWENLVKPGDKILVCDIGGGTSDFTLIQVRATEDYQQTHEVVFHRTAVGEHLILGGDNLDLTLAKYLETKFQQQGHIISPRQWLTLVRQARNVKEILLGANPPEVWPVTVTSAGAKLIGQSLKYDLTRREAETILLDGFFPEVELSARPSRRSSGFQEFGLPFAPDPAITRYLAAFLTDHRYTSVDGEITPDTDKTSSTDKASSTEYEIDPARPDIVLFNGGMFESPQVRQRLVDTLGRWFNPVGESGLSETACPRSRWSPLVLENDALDLAVARGAAYFGRIRRKMPGVRIVAALARTYYIGLGGSSGVPQQALCVAPAKAQSGQTYRIDQKKLSLKIGTPVEFPLYVSSTRLTDQAGDIVPINPETMRALAPLKTVIKSKRKASELEVVLQSSLSEIGTLELAISAAVGRGTWQLNFDVRASTQTDAVVQTTKGESQGVIDQQIVQNCLDIITRTFGCPENKPASNADPGSQICTDEQIRPSEVMKRLGQASELNRDQWPTTFLRAMWQTLMDCESSRKRTATLEARWLNLCGFCLRPGYGAAMDDWRIEQVWKTVFGKIRFPDDANRLQQWIFWRRIAGGLSQGRQIQLTETVLKSLRAVYGRILTGRGKTDWSFSPNEAAEIFRSLAAMENLPIDRKEELGRILLELAFNPKFDANRKVLLLAVGRLGTRRGMYGPLNLIVPPVTVEIWLQKIIAAVAADTETALPVVLMSQKTSDRYRDISGSVRTSVLKWLTKAGDAIPDHYRQLIETGGELNESETDTVFGETLPIGLKLDENQSA